jgi:thioredoxin 1
VKQSKYVRNLRYDSVNILEAFMSENITHVSDASFEADVLNSPVPVLVDFWAEWCGPCKAIAPVLDDLSGEYAGRLRIAKVNIEENEVIATKYGIRSIPTFILFKGGNVEATKVGAAPRAALTSFLDSNL